VGKTKEGILTCYNDSNWSIPQILDSEKAKVLKENPKMAVYHYARFLYQRLISIPTAMANINDFVF
jgi:hypothetical protein